jgi:hypothetical protein
LYWDDSLAELGIYQKKSVVLVPYRRRHGFNATSVQQAIGQINPATGEIKVMLN